MKCGAQRACVTSCLGKKRHPREETLAQLARAAADGARRASRCARRLRVRYEKVDPALLRVWRDREDLQRLERHVELWSVLIPELEDEPVRVLVSLHCAEDDLLDTLDPRWQVRVASGRGVQRSAVVPLDSVEALSEHPSVRRLVLSRRLRQKLDKACASVGLSGFRRQTQASGKGVIIGIIDSGIDVEHPAFQGRILAVWDQTLALPGVPDANRPEVLLLGESMRLSCDRDGHGTHVAAIAAGADPKFGGVAPEADFIIVKTDDSAEAVKQGLMFVFTQAAKLRRPVVANLSLGAHSDPHDGTDDLSALIDSLSGPGRIVCCAAGNEGNVDIHVRLEPGTRLVAAVEFEIPRCADTAGMRSVVLTGWHRPTVSAAFAVESPSGRRTRFVRPGRTGARYDGEFDLDGVVVHVATPPPLRPDEDMSFQVELSARDPGNQARAMGGTWKLLVRGEGRCDGAIDVWIEDTVGDCDDTEPSHFVGRHVDDSMKIGAPGAAHKAITVANYATRASWNTAIGTRERDLQATLGEVHPTSSNGPLRDGFKKPDIAAPGSMIVAARSSAAGDVPRLDVSRHHRIMGGTSMASPFVAGVVALILQHEPRLDPEMVRAALTRAARPAGAWGSFDPKSGYGLVRLVSDPVSRKRIRRRAARAEPPSAQQPAGATLTSSRGASKPRRRTSAPGGS